LELLRRPLLLAFALGCATGIIASGRLSLRTVSDGVLSFAFVPAIQLAAFAIVYWTGRHRRVAFARGGDLFFAGNTPWLQWLVMFTTVCAAVAPRRLGSWVVALELSALVPITWSGYLDYQFFRKVMERSARGAVRDLLVYRAIGWTGIVLYFLGVAMWTEPVTSWFD
jgi:hypothetical protein